MRHPVSPILADAPVAGASKRRPKLRPSRRAPGTPSPDPYQRASRKGLRRSASSPERLTASDITDDPWEVRQEPLAATSRRLGRCGPLISHFGRAV